MTVNATPGDPVQRGTICTAGTTCGGTRNLLDFMDVTTDAKGRVLVGYADGCIGDCVNGGPNSGTDLAAIARQKTGKGLYAQFDQPLSVPASPAVSGSITGGVAHITWSTPDDRGTPILGYRIYRQKGTGIFEQILGVAASVHTFDDPVPAGSTYSYKVTAVNAQGEGVACRSVSLSN